jgi:endonuclease/exonuclease/phosphatase (EEP) superfamily protein YafD
MGGDLNATSERRATELLARRYPDVWMSGGEGPGLTMPAASPVARIDFLFASPDLRVGGAWVGTDTGASDHLPVYADLEVQ